VRVGKWGGRGKEAGVVPHPKAELQRWLTATEEQRGGGGDRGAVAKAALARAARQEAAAAGLAAGAL
jgi:hypothetical protein